MIDKFLKAKHWQLFLLVFGLPLICQIILMGLMISNIKAEGNFNPSLMIPVFKVFPLLMILFSGVLFGWLWSIAIGLQSKIPENITMKVRKFKVLFFIPMVYILFISIFMSVTFSGIITTDEEPSTGLIGSLFGLIVPLHIFSMFCIFYTLYFVAKTIKTVEFQREVGFSDFAGDFFLLWFYFVGIWIIQPKINKMVE